MDDNKQNQDKNQLQDSNSVSESLSVDNQEAIDQPQQFTVEEIQQPEEVPPDISSPTEENIAPSSSTPSNTDVPVVFEDNKNKYFIIFGGIFVFLIIFIILIKLFIGGGTAKKQISLAYWGLWEDEQIFAPLIESYQKINPHIKINYQKMSPQDYRAKLLARSKNGQGPDIFRFHNTWLPQIKELAAPLPETVMTTSEFEKTFYKIHQRDLKIGNYYYGLPLEIDGLVLIYNENLFKKAGIETPPLTWDDITEIISKLTVKDKTNKIITSGIALGTTSNVEHYSDIFGLMLIQNGGSLDKLDQPEAAGALEIYRKFAEPPNEFWNETMPNSTTAFIQEKVAMIIAPSWVILSIKAANPDIVLKAVPVPTVPGAAPVSIANYWVEGVSRYSRHQLEAWKFLRFLVEKDNLTKLYENQAKTRPFGEPYSRVDLASLLIQNEYIGAVIKQADYYTSIPLISRTYDNGLNDEIIQYIENAINASIEGVSYSEALKTAYEGVMQVFGKYKIEN